MRALLLDEPAVPEAQLPPRPPTRDTVSRTGGLSDRPRTSGRRDSVPLQLDCTPKTRQSSRPGSKEGSMRGSSRDKARPESKTEKMSRTGKANQQDELGMSSVDVRMPTTCPFTEGSRQSRTPTPHYNSSVKENFLSYSPLGRDIGGDTRERAKELEAQEREVERTRQLVSSKLLLRPAVS
jgi:hypothetical protein